MMEHEGTETVTLLNCFGNKTVFNKKVLPLSYVPSSIISAYRMLTLLRSQKILTLLVFWGLFIPQTLTYLPTINT